ncbi:MAG: hypothetical protein ICV60_18605 [Pyrinomonadaceae bacterium]|nr:hypothetical protein [Pyrinomonadaceae bacterium]
MVSVSGKAVEPFSIRFIDAVEQVLLELANESDYTLWNVEILTVFLKDEETPGGGPSRAHVKFEPLKSIRAKERAVVSHKTWIDGRPVDAAHDQLERLKEMTGKERPYVLNISWTDAEGKTRFQRVPVGH